eukprot:6309540-Prymnesium_polylepis.1
MCPPVHRIRHPVRAVIPFVRETVNTHDDPLPRYTQYRNLRSSVDPQPLQGGSPTWSASIDWQRLLNTTQQVLLNTVCTMDHGAWRSTTSRHDIDARARPLMKRDAAPSSLEGRSHSRSTL